jgi:hypothetical protein
LPLRLYGKAEASKSRPVCVSMQYFPVFACVVPVSKSLLGDVSTHPGEKRFHWSFASLRCRMVVFTRPHNPRDASKATDPRVMASAVQMRGTERAEASSVRFSVQCFLPECYARLSRPEGCVMITSRTTLVTAPLVAGESIVRRRET